MKYTSLGEVEQVPLCSIYSYVLANDWTVNQIRPRLQKIGVCRVLPKVQALVKTTLCQRRKMGQSFPQLISYCGSKSNYLLLYYGSPFGDELGGFDPSRHQRSIPVRERELHVDIFCRMTPGILFLILIQCEVANIDMLRTNYASDLDLKHRKRCNLVT